MTRKEQLRKFIAQEKLKFEMLICTHITGTALSYKQIGVRFGVKPREVAKIATNMV